MLFHFQSVSGPQPYVVIASELKEWPSLHAILQRILPESLLQDFIPFLGCGSGGHSTEMRKIVSTFVWKSIHISGQSRNGKLYSH